MAQNNSITGNYFNESDYCLQIKKDSFKLVVQHTSPLMRSSEIWAEGVLKRINKDFIELNTINIPWEKVQKTIEVIQKRESYINDIEIKFTIPYNRTDLEITIYDEDFNSYMYIYSKNNNKIKIPKTESISFYIVPVNLLPHTPQGNFYGIIGFDSMIEYQIKEGMNNIEFIIPAIDDSFFERYNIVGDYARILNDSIIWKGDIYIKRE